MPANIKKIREDLKTNFPAIGLGVAAYLVIIGLAAVLIMLSSNSLRDKRLARHPSAESVVMTVKAVDTQPEKTEPDKTDKIVQETPEKQTDPPSIAIVVGHLGLMDRMAQEAINDLPPEISLAFTPYAGNVAAYVKLAQDQGHETLISLPMETKNFPQSDPGPKALRQDLKIGDNTEHLKWALQQTPQYKAIIPQMGITALQNPEIRDMVFFNLKREEKIFLDSFPESKNTDLRESALKHEVPYLKADLKIDSELRESSISQQLFRLERQAHKTGSAIGLAEATPLTFRQIKKWADSLENKEIRLVGVSALAPSFSP